MKNEKPARPHIVNRRGALAMLCAASMLAPLQAWTQGLPPIKIANIQSRTGPFEEYGNQAARGFQMGLEYATGGTMAVAGRKLVVIERDDQGKPDIGRSLLAAAYVDDRVDLAVGPTGSGVALAMLPVALEHKKLLVVEPAVSDSITGDKWNRYIFKTARNSMHDALSNAIVYDRENVNIATLAQDYAYGRDSVRAFKDALKKAKVVHEEYLPVNATDITAAAQRIFDRMKGLTGRKVIFVTWAGNLGLPFKLLDMDPARQGIEVATTGTTLPAMAQFKRVPGMEASTYYYYGIPKNPVNDWLVANHMKKFGSPPDAFTAGGMVTAIAVVEALKKRAGNTDTEGLIQAMEGMSFETPKGRMEFRKEDHQALQSMYHFKVKVDPAVAWGIPELVREIKPEEINLPIRNTR